MDKNSTKENFSRKPNNTHIKHAQHKTKPKQIQ